MKVKELKQLLQQIEECYLGYEDMEIRFVADGISYPLGSIQKDGTQDFHLKTIQDTSNLQVWKL